MQPPRVPLRLRRCSKRPEREYTCESGRVDGDVNLAPLHEPCHIALFGAFLDLREQLAPRDMAHLDHPSPNQPSCSAD